MLFKRKKNADNPIEQLKRERRYLLTHDQDFYLEEAYKSLRTNVMFSMAGKSGCRVVMVTASSQSEGKSITSANLALTFAQAGKNTLLVECDLRRPKQARLFGLKALAGLSNVLLQPEQLESVLLKTTEENLQILLSGDIPPNPSEMLGSEGMRKLLDQLREQFDYIILDTPPVNIVTDAMVLSDCVDGVLFVVRSGEAEMNSVKKAVSQLEYAGAKLLGFVLNDVKESGSSYGGYHHSYGYGYSEKAK